MCVAAATNRAATGAVLAGVSSNACDAYNEEEDGPPEQRFFVVRTLMDDSIDPGLKPGLAFGSPLVSAAIKEAVQFDTESKAVLVVRYPVAGCDSG